VTKSGSIPAPSVQYVLFDKSNGRILHTHSRFSVERNHHVEIPIDELKRVFSSDSTVLENLTDRNAANLEFLKIGPGVPEGPLMVDVARRTLVPQPRLSLSADKQELQGDGKDSATITLGVVDGAGNPVRNFKGQVKVTTTRGKLSAPRGVVDLVDGAATITLTSVPETVTTVRVQATAPNTLCASGYVTLEFV